MLNNNKSLFIFISLLVVFHSFSSQCQTGNPNWYFQNTGTNHTILIPANANITIDGDSISFGDFIGVFYDSLGFLACGGYTEWNGENSAISAWGSEAGNDGFESGEKFKWKIWDVSKNIEYSAFAVFNEIDFPNGEFYFSNGISGISGLDGYIFDVQQIDLQTGWGMYAVNNEPFEKNSDTAFSEITDNLLIVKNTLGELFFPEYNIYNLSYINYADILIVKMNAPDTLKIAGRKTKAELFEIELNAGWNLIPYLRHSNANIESVFSNISIENYILKDADGQVFYKYYNIDELKNFKTNKAYNIYCESQESFFYPSDTVEIEEISDENTNCIHFTNIVQTDNNQTVIILEQAIDSFLQENDELGIFDGNGNLMGSQIFEGGNISITVWEDDTLSQAIDGIQDNQKFIIKYWSSVQQKEEWLIIENFVSGDDIYIRNGIAIIDKFSFTGTSESQAFTISYSQNGEIQIDFFISENSFVNLYLYNISGQLIEKITENNMQTGKYIIHVDMNKYPIGEYFINLMSKKKSESKIFIHINL